MRETIDKAISPTLVSGPQRISVFSTGERKRVFVKTRHPKIPNTNPQINGRNPGPGLDSVPGSMRIDSIQIPAANTTQISELIRSYFFMKVSVSFLFPPEGPSYRKILHCQVLLAKNLSQISTESAVLVNRLFHYVIL
jgi:hypothetical protein